MSRLRMVSGKSIEDLLERGSRRAGSGHGHAPLAHRTIDAAAVQFDRRRGCRLLALRAFRRCLARAVGSNFRRPGGERLARAHAHDRGDRRCWLTRRRGRSTKLRCAGETSTRCVRPGLSDKDVLLIATAIAYHNYAIRMAAAFDVAPTLGCSIAK